MAKDKGANLHVSTGKSSVGDKNTVHTVDHTSLDDQIEIEDKYGIDPDTNAVDGVPVRHPNRNIDKDRERKSTTAKKGSKGTNGARTSDQPGAGPDLIGLSRESLEQLSSFSGPFCVTAYLPTHLTGAELNEQVDAIQLKNVLQEAERARIDTVDKRVMENTLAPAYALLRNDDFWRRQTAKGIAFFIGDGFFKYITLPSVPNATSHVNNAFLVGPLVPYIINQNYFYLLAISKKQSKLFRADAFGMSYIDLPEMPNGIEDVVRLEEKENQNLFRTGSSGAGGGANYHGMGSGQPDEKENIAMYLAEVDSTIRKDVLHNENVPLLLAGVGYLIPIYKRVSHYNNVWDSAITGNREYDNEVPLHQEAVDAMRSYFDEPKSKALAQYGDQSATDRTSTLPDEVIRAAHHGRINTLFVRKEAQLWGTYDEINDKVVVHGAEVPGDRDLVDLTVLKTVLTGGNVFILEEHEMPHGSTMAAIMRY